MMPNYIEYQAVLMAANTGARVFSKAYKAKQQRREAKAERGKLANP